MPSIIRHNSPDSPRIAAVIIALLQLLLHFCIVYCNAKMQPVRNTSRESPYSSDYTPTKKVGTFCACILIDQRQGGNTMPRGDNTGPMGQGPMTGRAAGFCAGYNVPGYGNTAPAGRGGFGSDFRGAGRAGFGRGFGRAAGRGLNAGFGFGGYATGSQAAGLPDAELSPENEREVLKRQQDYLAKELEAINKRLTDLEQ